MKMKILFSEGSKVIAEYKGFVIETDQPEADGGGNSAPAPFDLFLASIGTCAGYYVLAFCQSRHINTDKIQLVLNTERNSETRMIQKIKIQIQVPEDFSDKYKNALINSVNLCAVKKHIINPPEFEIITN